MKKLFKRSVSLMLSIIFLSSLFSIEVFAKESFTILDSNLEGYEYVKYNEPIEEFYNGKKSVLLGYLRPVGVDLETKSMDSSMKPMDNYREYDVYYVYDNGIIQTWSYLSNPYFIISIARGMEYEEEKTVSSTIQASYSGNYPSEAKSAINSAFGISASGTKTVTVKVKLSGPEPPYSSRDFYYQKGRHTHDVDIIQEHRSNWDGVLWTKEYNAKIGVPAIRTYSVDTY